jgi:putative tryptophan/tyrosine transport system substrate-binding protein
VRKCLFNPTTAPYAEYFLNPFKAAASSFGVEAVAAPVHATSELDTVFGAETTNGGLIVMPDTFTTEHREEIVNLL